MSKKAVGLIVLFIIAVITLVVVQFIPQSTLRYVMCFVGGVIARLAQKHITK